MDSTTLGSEKCKFLSLFPDFRITLSYVPDLSVEFAILTLDKDGKTPRAKIYRPAEIDALLQEYDLAKKEEDTVMRS